MQFIERHAGGERALLCHLQIGRHYGDELDHVTEEFEELALSAGVMVLELSLVKRDKMEARFGMGIGKARELADRVQALGADIVIINAELSPAQARNMEQLFSCRVIDRTELILDIFAKRARSHEGKLQVELAQLSHLSSRLVRGWTHLERQKGGIGLRGPGETQLETDRRLINHRIKHLKAKLVKVQKQRYQSRRARERARVPTLSLVGYTNAGKSTLFNALTAASEYVADQLFATLDTTLRKIIIPQHHEVVLADTVGFVRKLPHELVAAFNATLEETIYADLLVHVIDATAIDCKDLINEVDLVLRDIGADALPQLLVYNKIDAGDHWEPRLDRNEAGLPWRVWVSAKSGAGIDLLQAAIAERITQGRVQCDITLCQTQGDLRAELYRLQSVLAEHVNEQGEWEMSLSLEDADFQRLSNRLTH